MMVETWHSSARDRKRTKAYLATREGQREHKRWMDQANKALEESIALGMYKPTAEDLKELEEWRKNRDK